MRPSCVLSIEHSLLCRLRFLSAAAATMSMSDIAEGFIKHTEQTFGAAHPTREKVKNARRIVVKVNLAEKLGPKSCVLCPFVSW